MKSLLTKVRSNENIFPAATEPIGFDFSTLSNYITLDKTLLTKDSVYTDAPSIRYKVMEYGLYDEGSDIDRGEIELSRVFLPEIDSATLHDICLFRSSEFYKAKGFYSDQIDSMLHELIAKGAEIPSIWFRIYSVISWKFPSFAIILQNQFIRL